MNDVPKPTPSTTLEGMFEASEAQPPGSDGRYWFMAIGAQLAFGIADALSDDEIRRWEARAQAEADRLGLSLPTPDL